MLPPALAVADLFPDVQRPVIVFQGPGIIPQLAADPADIAEAEGLARTAARSVLGR